MRYVKMGTMVMLLPAAGVSYADKDTLKDIQTLSSRLLIMFCLVGLKSICIARPGLLRLETTRHLYHTLVI